MAQLIKHCAAQCEDWSLELRTHADTGQLSGSTYNSSAWEAEPGSLEQAQ